MSTPAIDAKNLCDKLALRFVAATLGTPTGAQAMRASYGARPKAVPATPFHYLEVDHGTLVANPSQWQHIWNIDGVFCLAKRPGDPHRVDIQRQLWLPFLLHATVDQVQIGVGPQAGYTVTKVFPDGGWDFDEVEVAGEEFDAIRVHWRAYITETVALAA